jgi:hypothetical protein
MLNHHKLAGNLLSIGSWFDRSKGRHWLPVGLILGAMLLATYWVFLVPIFQSPDEDYHADYVFSLYSKGRLIRGTEAPLVGCSHPYVSYLLKATDGQGVKYSYYVKMPKNYGTKDFFASIDRNMPDKLTCQLTATNPFVVSLYPFGYYAMTAIWLGALSHFNSSLSFLLFAGRFLSVLLLGCGLTISYFVMRELKLSSVQSSLVLAVIAFSPMVIMVGSYIQPDNLTFVAVSLCFLLSLRWRNSVLAHCCKTTPLSAASNVNSQSRVREYHPLMLWGLGVALSILFLTKYQFFCCVGTAIVLMIIATAIRLRLTVRKIGLILLILLTPTIIAAIPQLWVSWGCQLPTTDAKHKNWIPTSTRFWLEFRHGTLPFASYIWQGLYDEFESLYSIYGTTFSSFWGCFGQSMSAPLVIVSKPINDLLRLMLELFTKIVLLMTLFSLGKIFKSLLHLTSKRYFRQSLYIACSNPLLNSYFLFEIFFFLMNIYVYPRFWQGRHWFPLILPIVLSAVCFAPRFFSVTRVRRVTFFLIAIPWLVYSVVGSYYAVGTVKERYFNTRTQSPLNQYQWIPVEAHTICEIESCDFIDQVTNFNRHANTLMVPKGDYMQIAGWAVDMMAQAPASDVLFIVDGKKIYNQPAYGLDSWQPVEKWHNSKYRFSGFNTLIPTKDLSPGWHSLSAKVLSGNGQFLYNTDVAIKFIVLDH